LLLGFLNAFLRPILLLFMLPLNLLTLGLFTFVINAFLLLFVSQVVKGFEINGFWSALVGTILLSVISFLINLFISESGSVRYIYIDR
jgi:putative membrane protein